MKKLIARSLILALILALFAFPVMAQGEPVPGNPTIEFLVELIFGLAITVPGASALVVILINIGKALKWVPDTRAGTVSNVLSVGMALLIGAASLYTTWDIPGLDIQFSSLAANLTILLPVLVLILKWANPTLHSAIRGFPLLGYSNSK
jgi:hypothetical protein